LPQTGGAGVRLRLIAGTLGGLSSPVKTLSPTFYADLNLEPGAKFTLPPEHEERGAYIAEGSISVDGQSVAHGRLLVFRPAIDVVLTAQQRSRVMLLGGQSPGPRHVWWNFVSSSRARIEQAKEDWQAGRFGSVPGDPEFIPLPEERKPQVDYP
jgi:redox-sensitive bicupin YhaK (pirin superfamily)